MTDSDEVRMVECRRDGDVMLTCYRACDEELMQRQMAALDDLAETTWLGPVNRPAETVVPLRVATVEYAERERRKRSSGHNEEETRES